MMVVRLLSMPLAAAYTCELLNGGCLVFFNLLFGLTYISSEAVQIN